MPHKTKEARQAYHKIHRTAHREKLSESEVVKAVSDDPACCSACGRSFYEEGKVKADQKIKDLMEENEKLKSER
jgi:DNA repair exonuclease SbcCD ATPase subunit